MKYYITALYLLTTQGGYTVLTKWQLLKLIAKRQCRLHWLRD